jgi:hypothetical protein
MCRQLTFDELLAIRRALSRGWRYVRIAREMNVSVWTIARIANDPHFRDVALAEEDLPVDDAPPDYEAQQLRRCPGCGAMVYVWPCLGCRLAARQRPRAARNET